MNNQKRAGRPVYELFSHDDIEGFDSLLELALDLHQHRNPSADEIWRQLDPALWDKTRNPWFVLQTVSRDRLQKLLGDAGFRKTITSFLDGRNAAKTSDTWFQQNYSTAPLNAIAYFSMEFMLTEALPIYSGAIGNVAGAHLKSASDLGVPLVGVGLLYQQGCIHREINAAQRRLPHYNDPNQLPITPVRQANGDRLRLELALPGYSVRLRVWQARVGRLKLYLLDSNDPENDPARRGITSALYPEGEEHRLNQELVLGIGGWRLLQALGIKPEVCHLNESHAAFCVLERSRAFREETGQDFRVALTATRAGNLFTTHITADAALDHFSPSLIEQYLGPYAEKELGIPLSELLALGRWDPKNKKEPFITACLGMRGSGVVNGFSGPHGHVSRNFFRGLYERWPLIEVPINHVTSGCPLLDCDSREEDPPWTDDNVVEPETARAGTAPVISAVSTGSLMREYTEQYYIPPAISYRARASRKGALSSRMLQWQRALELRWAGVRFGELKVRSDRLKHVFEIPVYLNDIDPASVRVELYADGPENRQPVRQDMIRERSIDAGKAWLYTARTPSTQPATDYTPRVIPNLPGVSVPLEICRIRWQR